MRLIKSTPDDAQLVIMVHEKFLELCALYKRVREQELPIPADMQRAIELWRTVFVRHSGRSDPKGRPDFRHSIEELQAVRDVAQWTLDEKCVLCNQPKQTLSWV